MRSDRPPAWRETSWGDVAELAYGKALRERSADGVVPVYGTNGPTGRADRKLGDGPTVVIGRKGAYRGVHYAPGPFWVIDTAFFLVPSDAIDINWAYYELLTHDINGLDSGSAIPSTRREDFYAMRLLLPALQEQQRIAAILCSLDDKINSNQRTLSLLKQIGLTECSRVRSQADRESDISLGDLAAMIKRGITPKYCEPDGLLVLNQRCIRDNTIVFGPARRHDEMRAVSDERMLRIGDVLVNSTGVGTLGRVATVTWLPEPATVDSHVTIVRSNPDVIDTAFFAWDLMSRQAEIEALAEGTTGQTELSPKRLSAIPVSVPDRDTQQHFASLVEPLREQSGLLERETLTLTLVRDAVLPKLISGEIRVPEAGDRDEMNEPVADDVAAVTS